MPLSTTPSLSLPSLLDAVQPASVPCCEDQDSSQFNALLDPPTTDRAQSRDREPDELPPGATDFKQVEQIPPPSPAVPNSDDAADDARQDSKSKTPPPEKSAPPSDHHIDEPPGKDKPDQAADEVVVSSAAAPLAAAVAIPQPVTEAKIQGDVPLPAAASPEGTAEPLTPAKTLSAATVLETAIGQPAGQPHESTEKDAQPAAAKRSAATAIAPDQAQSAERAVQSINQDGDAGSDKQRSRGKEAASAGLASRDDNPKPAGLNTAALAGPPESPAAPPAADSAPAEKTGAAAPPSASAASPVSAISSAPVVGLPQAVAAGSTRLPPEAFVQSSKNAGRRAVSEGDTLRLLGRVARAFSAAQAADGEIRLRLSPPELGSLRLQVQVHEGALVARLETETAAARTALIDNLPALRDRLAEQGVRIERFDVDLLQRQPGGMSDHPGNRQQEMPPNQVALPPLPRPRSQAAIVAAPAPLAAGSASGLNVIV
jgi:flagellar hook-length control protein FliK